MNELSFLQDLLVLFGISVVVVVAFHRLNLPPIVGFLMTGAICGPFGLGLVEAIHQVEVLAEIGVVLLLFTIGIEFSIQRLTRLRAFLLLGGGLQVALTLGATLLLSRALGIGWQVATFLGMLVSLSSTAMVIRLLADHGQIEAPHGGTALGILIFQDLCIVPMVLLTPFLAGRGEVGALIWVVVKALIFVSAALIAARYVVPSLLYQAVKTRSRQVFLLTVILLCLGAAWATAQVGLSLALGAFIAGLVISESEYSHQALGEVLPFREFGTSLFFVSVGMFFNFQTVFSFPLKVLGAFLAVVVLKAVLAAGVTFLLGRPLRVAIITGFALAQIGEFSFVLSKVGRDVGLLGGDLNELFLAVAVGTMAVTPALCVLGPRVASWMERRIPRRWAAGRGIPVVSVANGRRLEDHVVIVGYGVNGRNLARVLRHVDIPYAVIEMNPETVRNERERGVPIFYGDASLPEVLGQAKVEKARVMVVAISDAAATRRVVELARRLNARLHLIVRTRYVQETEPLFALGAHEVVPEEFETSIEIFSRALQMYLVPHDVIERCVRGVRQEGYEMLRSAYETYRPAERLQRFLSSLSLEVYRAEARSAVAGKPLRDSRLREATGATALAIQRPDGKVVVNPTFEDVIREEDVVLLLGLPEQLTDAAALFRAGGEATSDGREGNG